MRRSISEVPAKASLALAAFLLSLATGAAAQVTSRALIPNQADSSLSIIDVATGMVQILPSVGSGSPNSVAVTPDGRRAYVGVSTLGVVLLDMSSGLTTTVAPANGVAAVVVTPDGGKAYFTDVATATVTPIDVATNTVGGAIAVGTSPLAVGVAPDGLHAYVLNNGADSITVLDTATDTVVDTINLTATGPIDIAFTPDSQTAYVATPGSHSVSVIDLVNRTEVLPAIDIGVGTQASHLAITPDGSTLFTANAGTGAVSVIDTATKAVLTTVPTSGPSTPMGIAITPDVSTAYVIDQTNNKVLLFDVATHTFAPTTIGVGNSPAAVGSFMSPRYIIPTGGELGFADETQLLAGLRSTTFANFDAGTLNVAFNWTSNRTFSLLLAGGAIDTIPGVTATLTNTTVGEGTLFKRGLGTLVLGSAFTTHHAGTHIDTGILQVDGHHTSPIALTGGTLSGTGTVGDVTSSFGGGGAIQPGTATTPGTLTAHDITLTMPVDVHIRLNGATAGSYDVLNATGTANLSGSFLNLTLGYTPGPNDTFTIVTNSAGEFFGFAEGTTIVLNNTYLHITYKGGASGHDVVLAVDKAPTISAFPPQPDLFSDATIPPIPFTIDDDFTDPSALTLFIDSSNQTLVPLSNIVINGTGRARTLSVTLAPGQTGQTTITIVVSDQLQSVFTPLSLTVFPAPRTYYLAEGATGSFFSTDISIANPNDVIVPATVRFYKADGNTIDLPYLLSPTSRLTLPVQFVPGLESAAFSTTVISSTGYPLAVERTMWWDETGYGAHGEKASGGPASQWYFAEGSQGYFHTYFLLLNPAATANVAHVTYFLEDGSPLVKDYALPPTSRTTVDIATEPELQNRSFGALVTFDTPGMAERAMYFGDSPLFSGGHDSSGATAPSTSWVLAEGATGSFFDTFILIANPNDTAATATMTYLPASGLAVAKSHVVAPHQRLTINIATEDPSLESAAVGTSVSSDQPVIVERSQYWPHGNWYEAHNSAGETAAGTKWALAEGRVGGPNHAQTYILLANSGSQPAQVTATFLRENGTTVVKAFTVPPTSRVNVAVVGPGSDVPELADENFGTSLISTQPIIVERSMYTDAGGVIWAAGTNATGTRMP